MMQAETLWQGSVQQTIFRELLAAFSRPGEVRDLSAWVEQTTAQRLVLATLMDGETTLADPHATIAAADWPLLQAQRGTSETARYVAVNGQKAPDFTPALGSLESPEFGATLLIVVDQIGAGELSLILSGPGVNGQCKLSVNGLHVAWLEQRADWGAAFPLGVDILLLDATRIVALPRTTQVAIVAGSFL